MSTEVIKQDDRKAELIERAKAATYNSKLREEFADSITPPLLKIVTDNMSEQYEHFGEGTVVVSQLLEELITPVRNEKGQVDLMNTPPMYITPIVIYRVCRVWNPRDLANKGDCPMLDQVVWDKEDELYKKSVSKEGFKSPEIWTLPYYDKDGNQVKDKQGNFYNKAIRLHIDVIAYVHFKEKVQVPFLISHQRSRVTTGLNFLRLIVNSTTVCYSNIYEVRLIQRTNGPWNFWDLSYNPPSKDSGVPGSVIDLDPNLFETFEKYNEQYEDLRESNSISYDVEAEVVEEEETLDSRF